MRTSKKIDNRKILYRKCYDNRDLWREDVCTLIDLLVSKYGFWYTGPISRVIEGDFEDFVNSVKKNSYKHKHKMILFKIMYPKYYDTIFSDMYCLVVYTKNNIELITLSEQYSISSHYQGRNKTAQRFIKAFENTFKNAVDSRLYAECC